MRNCSQNVSIALMLLACTATVQASGRKHQENEKVETQVEKFSIPSMVRFEFSRSVGAGHLVRQKEGKPGMVRRTFRVVTRGNKLVAKELLKEERTDAEATVILMGRAGYSASRGSYVRAKVRTMTATAYDPSPATIGRGATGRTCTGMKAAYGIVAVDPRVIPLGTLVFVEGYGFAIASDTGGAIRGNRIDLCYNSRGVANAFGVRTVKVHVFQGR